MDNINQDYITLVNIKTRGYIPKIEAFIDLLSSKEIKKQKDFIKNGSELLIKDVTQALEALKNLAYNTLTKLKDILLLDTIIKKNSLLNDYIKNSTNINDNDKKTLLNELILSNTIREFIHQNNNTILHITLNIKSLLKAIEANNDEKYKEKRDNAILNLKRLKKETIQLQIALDGKIEYEYSTISITSLVQTISSFYDLAQDFTYK